MKSDLFVYVAYLFGIIGLYALSSETPFRLETRAPKATNTPTVVHYVESEIWTYAHDIKFVSNASLSDPTVEQAPCFNNFIIAERQAVTQEKWPLDLANAAGLLLHQDAYFSLTPTAKAQMEEYYLHEPIEVFSTKRYISASRTPLLPTVQVVDFIATEPAAIGAFAYQFEDHPLWITGVIFQTYAFDDTELQIRFRKSFLEEFNVHTSDFTGQYYLNDECFAIQQNLGADFLYWIIGSRAVHAEGDPHYEDLVDALHYPYRNVQEVLVD